MEDCGPGKEKAVESPPQNLPSKKMGVHISELVTLNKEYQWSDNIENITAFPVGNSKEDSLAWFKHITEMTNLTVQLIFDFAKELLAFKTLCKEDDITLLKGCASEVIMLRMAQKYNPETDSIVFSNDLSYTLENFHSAGMGDLADSIFRFCRNMNVLKLDDAEYVLLTVIVIFSERPCLMQPKKVENIQNFYTTVLRDYIAKNRGSGNNFFAHLMFFLVELRTLSNMNYEFFYSLKRQYKNLPSLLEQIWDLEFKMLQPKTRVPVHKKCKLKKRIIKNCMKRIKKFLEERISELITLNEEYQLSDDIENIPAFPLGNSKEDSLAWFKHITEMTNLNVQLIMQFANELSDFQALCREDRNTLLKGCASEVIMLRMAQKYNPETDSIVFTNDLSYTLENFRSAGMGDLADSIFRFCRNMNVLKLDNAEYALLTVIDILSERPCLLELKTKVERHQDLYINILRDYIAKKRGPRNNFFARLMFVLVELRTLSNMNYEFFYSLKRQYKNLPSSLEELWDLEFKMLQTKTRFPIEEEYVSNSKPSIFSGMTAQKIRPVLYYILDEKKKERSEEERSEEERSEEERSEEERSEEERSEEERRDEEREEKMDVQ